VRPSRCPQSHLSSRRRSLPRLAELPREAAICGDSVPTSVRTGGDC
jgi:hypothetical protein